MDCSISQIKHDQTAGSPQVPKNLKELENELLQ